MGCARSAEATVKNKSNNVSITHARQTKSKEKTKQIKKELPRYSRSSIYSLYMPDPYNRTEDDPIPMIEIINQKDDD